MTFDFCPKCGEKLVLKPIGDEGEVPFCESCARPWFSYSAPCVICLCMDGEGNCALIRQSYGVKKFACVAGYLKAGETAEEAVRREISEEIGLDAEQITYIGSYYYPKHDNLMLGFAVRVNRGDFRLSDEVETAQWFPRDEAIAAVNPDSIVRKLMRDYFGI